MATFCEGCPFANGVTNSNAIRDNFDWDSPEFIINFVEGDKQTNFVQVKFGSGGYTDSNMVGDAIRAVERRTRRCEGPSLLERKRLGGLLGRKVIEGCNAFPGQDPRYPRINPDWSPEPGY